MSNIKYYLIAKNAHQIYISYFPQDTGNLKYNATKLKDFQLTRTGAKFRIHTSGNIAYYAQWVNDGYDNKHFMGKNTGKSVQGQHFYEKGAVSALRYMDNAIEYRRYTGFDIQRAKDINAKQDVDSDARRLVMHKSMMLTENGTFKLGKPSSTRIKAGDDFEL